MGSRAEANKSSDSMDAGEPANWPINITGGEEGSRVGYSQALTCI